MESQDIERLKWLLVLEWKNEKKNANRDSAANHTFPLTYSYTFLTLVNLDLPSVLLLSLPFEDILLNASIAYRRPAPSNHLCAMVRLVLVAAGAVTVLVLVMVVALPCCVTVTAAGLRVSVEVVVRICVMVAVVALPVCPTVRVTVLVMTFVGVIVTVRV